MPSESSEPSKEREPNHLVLIPWGQMHRGLLNHISSMKLEASVVRLYIYARL